MVLRDGSGLTVLGDFFVLQLIEPGFTDRAVQTILLLRSDRR